MSAVASILWTGIPGGQLSAQSAPVSVDSKVSTEWRRRRHELIEIRKYRVNWDGFDSDPPDPAVVDAAISFLHVLEKRQPSNPPLRVALAPDGEIAIEWHLYGTFTRAEIANLDQVEWMIATPGRETSFEVESLRSEGSSAYKRDTSDITSKGPGSTL